MPLLNRDRSAKEGFGVADQDRLTDMLLSMAFPPTTPEAAKVAVVAELTELARMRGTALTEEEWEGWRRGVLDGLAEDRHPEPVLLLVPVVYGLAAVALLVYFVAAGNWPLAGGAGAGVAFAAFLGWWLLRGLSAKRRLTPAERLGVVEELVSRGLVSPEEASGLRDRIAALGAGRSDADRGAGADGGA